MALTHRTTTHDATLPAVGRGALLAAGVAGLIYALSTFGTFPDGPPVSTATAAQIRDHVTTNGTAIRASAVVGMVAIAAALIFFAALTRQVRDRLPGSLLADLVLVASVLVIAYQWLITTAEAMISLLPHLIGSDLPRVDDATLRGWYGLTGFTHFLGDLAIIPMAVALAAFSMASLRGHLLPRWLSWAGVAVAAAGSLGSIGILLAIDALYPAWFAGLFGYWIWILAAAITFLAHSRRPRPHADLQP
jgi:hypothetical protein